MNFNRAQIMRFAEDRACAFADRLMERAQLTKENEEYDLKRIADKEIDLTSTELDAT